jgi:hypothetical protein
MTFLTVFDRALNDVLLKPNKLQTKIPENEGKIFFPCRAAIGVALPLGVRR